MKDFSQFSASLREFIRTSIGTEGVAVFAPAPEARPHPMQPGVCREAEAEFQRLANELFQLQFEHNEPYRAFCRTKGVAPRHLEQFTDIPAIPTSAFKELALSSLPIEMRTTVFHSSGTSVQRPSRHFHNAESLRVYECSALAWFRVHALPHPLELPVASATQAPSLALLAPPPAQAAHSSLVHMFEVIRRALGADAEAFLGRTSADGAWLLDLNRTRTRLERAVELNEPLMLLGTAFSFVHLLDYLMEQGSSFRLPRGSCLMETGGYKGRSRTLAKAELHSLLSDRLGIPPTQILCEYGMSELSSQAYDLVVSGAKPGPAKAGAPLRCLRFPPWARAQIISPETGREMAEGETGLIRVIDLANVYSVMAVQTEDLGVRRGANGFEWLGRASVAEPRGCSLMAV